MHWGGGQVVEEAWVRGEYHEPTIQLLEYTGGPAAGQVSLRFCSFRDGRFQRSPLMLDEEDVEPLREAIARQPRIRDLLKRLVQEPGEIAG